MNITFVFLFFKFPYTFSKACAIYIFCYCILWVASRFLYFSGFRLHFIVAKYIMLFCRQLLISRHSYIVLQLGWDVYVFIVCWWFLFCVTCNMIYVRLELWEYFCWMFFAVFLFGEVFVDFSWTSDISFRYTLKKLTIQFVLVEIWYLIFFFFLI